MSPIFCAKIHAQASAYTEVANAEPLTVQFAPELLMANGTHYEDPKGGCRSDEVDITIQGIQGAVCSPACTMGIFCPSDVPAGVTAAPQCALQDSSTQKKYCALICSPSSNDAQCGTNASCKSISGTGLCTYDDAADTSKATTVKYDPSIVV